MHFGHGGNFSPGYSCFDPPEELVGGFEVTEVVLSLDELDEDEDALVGVIGGFEVTEVVLSLGFEDVSVDLSLD